MYRAMYRILFAVLMFFTVLSASAVTMTFDDLPHADPDLHNYTENGITASADHAGLGYWGKAGRLHLDDSGSWIASNVGFSTGGLFDAVSFDVPQYGLTSLVYEFYDTVAEEWIWVFGIPYHNVGVKGFRDGELVAETTFYSEDYSTYFLDALKFADIDYLTISALRPSPAEIQAVRESVLAQHPGATDIAVWCFDSPCGHFDIDNLVLDPALAAPAPPTLALLALGMIALGATRRAVGIHQA